MISFGKVISIGIPALILLYVFYLITFNVPIIYTIDIGSNGDTDSGSDAYIRDLTAQGRISESMSLEDDTFRIMNGSPVYFYITPKNSISNHTNITVELKFKGDSDLDIGVYKDYAWKPLYIKNIENYTPVRQFGDFVMYAKNDSGNYTDDENISEWIAANIPKYSSIGSYDYEIDPEIFKNRYLIYENTYTEINQTFRGTHSFLIYLKDTLNMTIGKQDLNWYNGSDEYSVELYDDEGTLKYNNTLPDDGISDNSSKRVPPQFEIYSGTGIREGLYELRLVNIKGENEGADSTITSIKINTDKIITIGTIFLLDPGTLYFDLKSNKAIRVNSKQAQDISIGGTVEKEVVIDKKRLNKWVTIELPIGSYIMSIDGAVYVSGANFAFTNGSFFQPYNYEISSENSDWVISNYQVEKDNEDWITAKKVYRVSEIELLNNKTMVFGLRKKDKSEVELDEFKVALTPR